MNVFVQILEYSFIIKRVIGIGGVFFKSKDPVALRQWYKDYLGIDVQEWGGTTFDWKQSDGDNAGTATAWRIAPLDDKSFSPSTSPFMVNYLVEDLTALLELLRQEGCNVIDEFDEGEFGKFGWVLDPDENKIVRWEPAAS